MTVPGGTGLIDAPRQQLPYIRDDGCDQSLWLVMLMSCGEVMCGTQRTQAAFPVRKLSFEKIREELWM